MDRLGRVAMFGAANDTVLLLTAARTPCLSHRYSRDETGVAACTCRLAREQRQWKGYNTRKGIIVSRENTRE